MTKSNQSIWRVGRSLIVGAVALGAIAFFAPDEAGAVTVGPDLGADAGITGTLTLHASSGPGSQQSFVSDVFEAAGTTFTQYFLLDLQLDAGTLNSGVTLDTGQGITDLVLALFDPAGDGPNSGNNYTFTDADKKGETSAVCDGGECSASLFFDLVAADYIIRVTGSTNDGSGSYTVTSSVVPLPPAVVLLVSAVVGIVGFGARRSRAA